VYYSRNFDAQMKLFSSENLWIASLGEVSSYLRQKETCTIQVKKYLTRIKIIVESEYDIPLTSKIKINWRKVKVKEVSMMENTLDLFI